MMDSVKLIRSIPYIAAVVWAFGSLYGVYYTFRSVEIYSQAFFLLSTISFVCSLGALSALSRSEQSIHPLKFLQIAVWIVLLFATFLSIAFGLLGRRCQKSDEKSTVYHRLLAIFALISVLGLALFTGLFCAVISLFGLRYTFGSKEPLYQGVFAASGLYLTLSILFVYGILLEKRWSIYPFYLFKWIAFVTLVIVTLIALLSALFPHITYALVGPAHYKQVYKNQLTRHYRNLSIYAAVVAFASALLYGGMVIVIGYFLDFVDEKQRDYGIVHKV